MIKTKQQFKARLARFAALVFSVVVTGSAHAKSEDKHCRYALLQTLPITFADLVPTIEGTINGKPMKMLVDTGAWNSFLFESAVKKAGLRTRDTDDIGYGIAGMTNERSAWVKEMRIGPMHADKFDMTVLPDTSDIAYDVDLGERFLFQYDMEMSLAGQFIKFFAPDECGDYDYLAYWDPNAAAVPMKDMGESDERKSVPVEINGHKLRALIDSGAGHSIIYSSVAEKIGLIPQLPGAAKGDRIYGIGTEKVKSWVVPFDTFQIGGELITHGKIEVTDSRWKDRQDMILGADFLRAHRLLFAESQKRLYFSYLGGNVFYTDPKDDFAWYLKAAELGNAGAQFRLGYMYDHGDGTPEDSAKAFDWYGKAAEKGEGRAQANLGRMYEYGRGIDKDEAKAVAWYRKAADQENAWGEFFLGNMYRQGKGVAQNEAQAMAWYMKAAQQGNRAVDWELGRSLFLSGKYAESMHILQVVAKAWPKYRYVQLWLYLARAKANDGAAASKDLDAMDAALQDKKWPEPIVDFYLGRLESPALFALAQDKDADAAKGQLCEANFYMAEKLLLQEKQKEALPLFEAAAHDCPRNFIELDAAQAELTRLKAQDANPLLKGPAAEQSIAGR